jgi:RimJ/RimL family protein N-acetyltransferase
MTSQKPPGPAYRIRTPRLVVRCWEPQDAPRFTEAISASWHHLQPWFPWAQGSPPTLQANVALLRRWRGEFDLDRDFVYGIFSVDETLALGSSGLHTRRGQGVREIGYWIHADHVNRGYATETAAALTRVAFEIDGARHAEIHCLTTNAPSAAVARKLGYVHEADLRRRMAIKDDDYRDTMVWTMLAEEYPDSPAAEVTIEAYDAAGQRLL